MGNGNNSGQLRKELAHSSEVRIGYIISFVQFINFASIQKITLLIWGNNVSAGIFGT